MPRPRSTFPKLRLHKPTNRAVVTVRLGDGTAKDLYLGRWNSAASRIEYERVCAVLAAHNGTWPADEPDLTVNELLLAYVRHAADYYRGPDGRPTDTLNTVKLVARAVRSLYGPTPAAAFGPKELKTVRQGMVDAGLSRGEVNARVGVVKRVYKWAVSEGLVPVEAYQRLLTVEGLRAGRTTAPDHPRVRPAAAAHVEAILPHLPPAVAALVRLQRMTGARCGELVVLRPADIDRTDPAAWAYRPAVHKGSWRGKDRVIYLGKRCQELLTPWLLKSGGPNAYAFAPARTEAERNVARSEKRVTKRWPSHMARNERKRVKNRRRPPGDRYTTRSVRQAIERACEKAGVPPFTPHQLRHLAATEIRAELGPEVARAVLGHTLAAMTEHYSREVDRELARKAVERFW